MAYIDKLIGKFNKAQNAINSIKGVAAKIQSVNYNTALDELGEAKAEAEKLIKERRASLEKSLGAKNRKASGYLKQTPAGQDVELVYPLHDDLANYLVFDIRGRRVRSTEGEGGQTEPNSIALYVPDGIVSSANVEYQTKGISPMNRALADLAKTFKDGGGDLGEKGMAAGKQLAGAAINSMLDGLTGGLTNLAAGVAVNPLEEQTLSGIPFRSWSLSFEFHPRSEDEARLVNRIIHTFRTSMLPDTFSGDLGTVFSGKKMSDKESVVKGNFFNYPNIFDIYFDGPIAGKIDGFLPAVLTSCEVDHTGGAKFATYYDGQPTKTSMTLEFLEIRILTQQNYKAISAIDEEGNPRGNDERRNALSDGGGSILDTASRTNSFGSEELNNRAEGPPPSG
mgnify:FL=1|tara:strand:- start:1443 stop:2627 length:1185 start_codon:yes stop_codon:yes gene_type:complete